MVVSGRYRLHSFILGIVVLVASLLTTAGTADAASSSYYSTTYTRTFTATKQHYFTTIKRCVRVTVRGSVSFRLYSGYTHLVTYRTRKVIHPSLTVETFPACVVGPQLYKPVYKMSLTQRWASSTCSAGLSIGVSAPWGVSVGATPSCSKAKLARRSTSYTGRTGVRTQYNSTTKVTFGDEYMKPIAVGYPVGPAPVYHAPLCFKVATNVVVYPTRLSGSDSYVAALNPCVQK